MTTGRINQITRSSGTPGGTRAAEAARGPGAHPPEGGKKVDIRKGRPKVPGRRDRPRRTGGATRGHPIAPTKPLSAGPHAGHPPAARGRGLGAAAYGPRVEGPIPRGPRWRTADAAGRFPPGIWFQVWRAANRPQTPSVPGPARAPGFGCCSGAPRRSAEAVLQQAIPAGDGAGPEALGAPGPGRGSVRQGRGSTNAGRPQGLMTGAGRTGGVHPVRGGNPDTETREGGFST
jgi:hypothetical protein